MKMKLLLLKAAALLLAASGVQAYEDESTSSSLLRGSDAGKKYWKGDPNRIHCKYDTSFAKTKNIKKACKDLNDGHDVPYECDSGVEICCTESNIKKTTMSSFGTCHIMSSESVESERRPTPTPRAKPGQCVSTGPRRTRESQQAVCLKMGTRHTQAYYCSDPENVCCTKRTPRTVETNWGECSRGRSGEYDEVNIEDEKYSADDHEEPIEVTQDANEPKIVATPAQTGTNQDVEFASESASIRCIEPTIRSKRMSHLDACEENLSTPVPYVCDKGAKLCCTRSSITNPNLSGYGQCHKLYIPNEHAEEGLESTPCTSPKLQDGKQCLNDCDCQNGHCVDFLGDGKKWCYKMMVPVLEEGENVETMYGIHLDRS